MTENGIREQIARLLCKQDGWNWEDLQDVANQYYDAKVESDYLRDADAILAIPAIAKGLELRKKGKEIFELGDKILEFADHGDYSNGVEAFGIDEGRVRAYDHLKRLEEHWGTLKAGFRKVVTE